MLALTLKLAGGLDLEAGADTDARLLSLAIRKDQNAFGQLVRRHYQVVYRVVWRLMNGHADTEDVTQEAFLRLWKNPGQVRDASVLRSWLIKVASNLVMDRFRARPLAELDDALEVADGRATASEALDRQEVAGRMSRALANLPDRQRLALTLVQFEHMSNAEAAEAMDISVDALESLLARGRRSLKDDLADEWEDMLAALTGSPRGER